MKRIVTVTLNPCVDKTININGFEYGGLNRVTSDVTSVGGKGINCAAVLGSMGHNVFSCGITAGEQTQLYLDTLGIPHGYTVCKGSIRTNYKIVNTMDQVTTEINEPGFSVTDEDIERFISLFDVSTEDAGGVIISGSAPKGVSDEIYFRLTSLAQNKGIPVILDADGDKMAQGIKAVPYAIKPNLFELEQLTGEMLTNTDSQLRAVKNLLSAGIKLVVLSLGSDGAIVADDGQVIRVHAPKVNCVSTVGAGDSMAAVMAYGIVNNLSLEDIGRMAVCAGSLTCEKVGLCNGQDIFDKYLSIKTEVIG